MLINTRCTKDYQYFLVDPTEDVLMNERKIWIFHAAFELDFRFCGRRNEKNLSYNLTPNNRIPVV